MTSNTAIPEVIDLTVEDAKGDYRASLEPLKEAALKAELAASRMNGHIEACRPRLKTDSDSHAFIDLSEWSPSPVISPVSARPSARITLDKSVNNLVPLTLRGQDAMDVSRPLPTAFTEALGEFLSGTIGITKPYKNSLSSDRAADLKVSKKGQQEPQASSPRRNSRPGNDSYSSYPPLQLSSLGESSQRSELPKEATPSLSEKLAIPKINGNGSVADSDGFEPTLQKKRKHSTAFNDHPLQPSPFSGSRPHQVPFGKDRHETERNEGLGEYKDQNHIAPYQADFVSLKFNEHTGLAKVFQRTIHPAIDKAKKRNRDNVPELELIAAGKRVTEVVMNQKLLAFLRECRFDPDHEQRKEIKRNVKDLFSGKIKEFAQRLPNSPASFVDQSQPLEKATPGAIQIESKPSSLTQPPSLHSRGKGSNEDKSQASPVFADSTTPYLQQAKGSHAFLQQRDNQYYGSDTVHQGLKVLSSYSREAIHEGVQSKRPNAKAVVDPDKSTPLNQKHVTRQPDHLSEINRGTVVSLHKDKQYVLPQLGQIGINQAQSKHVESDANTSKPQPHKAASGHEMSRGIERLARINAPPIHDSRIPLDPHLERLVASLSTHEPKNYRPYRSRRIFSISHADREHLVDNANVLSHVQFSTEEQNALQDAIRGVSGKTGGRGQHLTAVQVRAVLKEVYNDPQGIFQGRDVTSVGAYIGQLQLFPETPKTQFFSRIETRIADPTFRPESQVSSLLRHREIGCSRGRHTETQSELCLRLAENIRPWRSWKGASGDVVAVAWGPDSMSYAIGAAAHTNPEDLQYNRPCNLLFGELETSTLRELPDHRIERPRPEAISAGPNSSEAVYSACDPIVYKTVSSIAFDVQTRMYTASHDHTVKVWDVLRKQCIGTLLHEAEVTSVETSKYYPSVFATGSKCIKNAVQVHQVEGDFEDFRSTSTQFSSNRAEARPAWQMYPECLRWGSTQLTSHLLLAGFQKWGEDDEAIRQGQLCLWDVETGESIKVGRSSQSVFAATWHPILPFFATGGAPGGGPLTDKRNTKSVVRTWDIRQPMRFAEEYECTALDMQDITFHPFDSNLVTAGCTDGTSFVWDFRWPQEPIHRLHHGRPLVDWDHTRSREEGDTGVMMSLWGVNGSLYYTGSSDGMIKAWDVRRHPEDVLVRNVAQLEAGIQSGAFSPDGTNLLVGDAIGGVHILSSAPCGPCGGEDSDGDEELPIQLLKSPDGSGKSIPLQNLDDTGKEGIEAARGLVESGQLELNPRYGAGKGPNYSGPYSSWARSQTAGPNLGYQRALAEERRMALNKNELLNAKLGSSVLSPRIKIGVLEAKSLSLSAARRAMTAASWSQRPQVDMTDNFQGASDSWQRPTINVFNLSESEGENPFAGLSVYESVPQPPQILEPTTPPSTQGIGDSAVPEYEMVEENHWWPRMGEDEIAKVYGTKAPERRG